MCTAVLNVITRASAQWILEYVFDLDYGNAIRIVISDGVDCINLIILVPCRKTRDTREDSSPLDLMVHTVKANVYVFL